MHPNAIETLLPDEKIILDNYRRARVARFASVHIHIHDGVVAQIEVTEKFRPNLNRIREIVSSLKTE